MKVIAAVLALAAVASAGVVSPFAYSPTVVARAPGFDSAVIKSDRLGGNFAYSVAENHAYAAHTPVVQHVTQAVGVSYAAGAPVVTGYSAPAVHAVHAYRAGPIAYNAGPAAFSYGYGAPIARFL